MHAIIFSSGTLGVHAIIFPSGTLGVHAIIFPSGTLGVHAIIFPSGTLGVRIIPIIYTFKYNVHVTHSRCLLFDARCEIVRIIISII